MVSLGRCWHGEAGDVEFHPSVQRVLRRSDDFIRLAVAAATEVLHGENGADIGLILCSAYGPMETNFDVLQMVIDGEAVSPALFSHSVFNAAAGYIAAVCAIQGPLFTLTEFDLPFFRGLQQGWLAVESGFMRRCLVMQVETYSRLLADAVADAGGNRHWPAVAVCWSLEKGGDCLVAMPELTPLAGRRRVLVEGCVQQRSGEHPLTAVCRLTEDIRQEKKERRWKVRSPVTECTIRCLKG